MSQEISGYESKPGGKASSSRKNDSESDGDADGAYEDPENESMGNLSEGDETLLDHDEDFMNHQIKPKSRSRKRKDVKDEDGENQNSDGGESADETVFIDNLPKDELSIR